MKGLVTRFKEYRRKHRVRRITNPGDTLETIVRYASLALIGGCALALLYHSMVRP
jgi:hypothetical protein